MCTNGRLKKSEEEKSRKTKLNEREVVCHTARILISREKDIHFLQNLEDLSKNWFCEFFSESNIDGSIKNKSMRV